MARAGGAAAQHRLDLADALRDEGEFDGLESGIDATFSPARGDGEEIEWSRRGKGVRILAIVDRHGLSVAVSTHAANHDEVRCVQLCFDFTMLEAKPENLIGDKAFASCRLDAELQKQGVELIAPQRSQSANPQNAGRPLASPLRPALGRGKIFRLVAMEAAASDPLGILRRQLPRLRAAWMHHDVAEAVFR